ncbi:hypothetical protein KP78_25740 [Jeotgalibacillus soli]|uniref:Uncharacterized protein n=1 Tax=Jeotgalibacillus soli TaxID=889306 RepID=A0A0C2R472_9BACL|nr:hypothetical protein KP78_25740 [Jeotgalibacillus soli]
MLKKEIDAEKITCRKNGDYFDEEMVEGSSCVPGVLAQLL